MWCVRRSNRWAGHNGFTLAEMAIVIAVIGTILVAVLPALGALRTAGQRSATEANLQALMRATAAYVQATGCLPCPMPAQAGKKLGRVRGDTSADVSPCGQCIQPEGIAPFISLGLTQGQAKDGWGRWITMRIDPLLAENSANIVPPFTPCTACDMDADACAPGEQQATGCSLTGKSEKGLCRANLRGAAGSMPIVLRQTNDGGTGQQVAVIFVSHGKNGRGAYKADLLGGRTAFPNMPDCSSSGAGAEKCNARDTSAEFWQALQNVNETNPFDDILAYAGRNALVSMLGNGSCNTMW